MSDTEYQASETCFMGVCDSKGNILEFEKLDGVGIKPTELARAITKSRMCAESLYNALKLDLVA